MDILRGAKVAAPPKPTGAPPSVLEAEGCERLREVCREVDVACFRCKWGEAKGRVAKTFGKSRGDEPVAMAPFEKWLGCYHPLSK